MTTIRPPEAASLAGRRGLVGLLVAGLALRAQLTVIGPLLPRIQDDLQIAYAVAGLLTTLPVLCMGLAAFAAPLVVGRVGSSAAVGGALLLVAGAGLARAVAPEVALILGATLIVGVGLGTGSATVPVFIKEWFADRPAGATGAHVTAVILGAFIVSSTAVPIAQALGSWRWPLAISSMVTLVAAVIWVALTGGRREPSARRGPGQRLPRGLQTVVLLATVFSLQSLLFFGLATWLPSAFIEHGWSETAAGSLVAVLIVTGLPGSIGVGWLADRIGSRRTYLTASALTVVVCCVGFVALPAFGFVWAAAVGLALGALFALVMTLPLDAAARPADVGALTGVMLGIGYISAAIAPVAMGAVRDLVGTFNASIGLLALPAAALAVLSMQLTRDRLAKAHETT